jgi:hypothetical protein
MRVRGSTDSLGKLTLQRDCVRQLALSGDCAQDSDEPAWGLELSVGAHEVSYDDFVKYFSNKSCERFAPSSVKTTDFALVAGSEM